MQVIYPKRLKSIFFNCFSHFEIFMCTLIRTFLLNVKSPKYFVTLAIWEKHYWHCLCFTFAISSWETFNFNLLCHGVNLNMYFVGIKKKKRRRIQVHFSFQNLTLILIAYFLLWSINFCWNQFIWTCQFKGNLKTVHVLYGRTYIKMWNS